MIVFLIDADNLSMPAWIDEAFDKIKSVEGAISVRRAYGGAEKLKGLEDVLQRHAIRQFLNLSLTKNTTDVALAVDAMELACKTPLPKTIIIGSGDVDFLPLVVRLRERGIHTVCVSARSKMSKEAISAYNQVIYVGLDTTAEDQVLGEKANLSSSIPKAAPAKKVPAKKVIAKKVSNTPIEATVDLILKSVPTLSSGEWHPLNEIHKPFTKANLIGKSAKSPKVFKKFPESFELIPEIQPNKVRYLVAPTN